MRTQLPGMYGLWYMDTKWIGSLQMDQENCLTLADVASESRRRKVGKDSSPSVVQEEFFLSGHPMLYRNIFVQESAGSV